MTYPANTYCPAMTYVSADGKKAFTLRGKSLGRNKDGLMTYENQFQIVARLSDYITRHVKLGFTCADVVITSGSNYHA